MATQSTTLQSSTIGMEKHTFTYAPTVTSAIMNMGFLFFVQNPTVVAGRKACDDILVSNFTITRN